MIYIQFLNKISSIVSMHLIEFKIYKELAESQDDINSIYNHQVSLRNCYKMQSKKVNNNIENLKNIVSTLDLPDICRAW